MHEEQEPSSTTNRVEGEAETVAQLGSNYGNVGFFRGNSFVLSLGPRWTIMVLVCLLVIAASVTVVLVRNAPSTSSPPDPSEPLAVAVKTVVDGCQLSWVTPKSPAELEAVMDPSVSLSPEQWATWEHSKDGAQASEAAFTVTAQGREATSNVVITGVRVKILEKRPPLKGTLLYRQCGGPVYAHYMAVDLDSRQPVSFPDDLDSRTAAELVAQGVRADPIRFPYSVSATEVEVFTVTARTSECDCTWVIEFDWSTEGRSGVQTVTNNGQPFRTTSNADAVPCPLSRCP